MIDVCKCAPLELSGDGWHSSGGMSDMKQKGTRHHDWVKWRLKIGDHGLRLLMQDGMNLLSL